MQRKSAKVTGDVHGNFVKPYCAPWLGPPHGPAPACNRALVDHSGTTSFQLPAGSFHVYATRGPFWTLARERVDLAPGVATEHDVVTDFAAAVVEAGVSDVVRVMAGVESTTEILFFTPPGASVPKVMGHFNFWPLHFDPLGWRGGAPAEEQVEPGELYDRAAALFDGDGVLQLNHPLGSSTFGRDHGYIGAMGYDPRDALPAGPEWTPAGVLMRRPGGEGGHRNIDHDVQEVMNGSATRQFLRYRPLWFSFLNQGVLRAGSANSDSHTLGEEVLGSPRNLVAAATTVADFDAGVFNAAVKAGRMTGTNGPVLTVTLEDATGVARGPSLTPLQPAPDAALHIEVAAAPWVVVDEVRVIVNGVVARRLQVPEALVAPADPFGGAASVRVDADVPLSELLDGVPGDAWIVVEAGRPLWPAEDLDDDGVPDTTDTNGDGAIDAADQVDPDDEDTWWAEPPRPAPDDAGFHQWIVAPGTWTAAFTNPLLIDRGGDGWTPPGLPAAGGTP